jgi:hypothetical protein
LTRENLEKLKAAPGATAEAGNTKRTDARISTTDIAAVVALKRKRVEIDHVNHKIATAISLTSSMRTDNPALGPV